ncbi:MAG: hypothetical protein KatS3mg082_3012 [Nitrospiraceae bacterium]|nr:MAG: hypothetical protein KatS3mg082_2682 [Nitrospiraceae bacterium]GIW56608.1 MAG: hypothetical protein KatS3mg082_3012 [Nitrospiraceae bacterium]
MTAADPISVSRTLIGALFRPETVTPYSLGVACEFALYVRLSICRTDPLPPEFDGNESKGPEGKTPR